PPGHHRPQRHQRHGPDEVDVDPGHVLTRLYARLERAGHQRGGRAAVHGVGAPGPGGECARVVPVAAALEERAGHAGHAPASAARWKPAFSVASTERILRPISLPRMAPPDPDISITRVLRVPPATSASSWRAVVGTPITRAVHTNRVGG